MNRFARLDRKHVWHPFTQMQDWMRREPIVVAEGRGAVLRDVRGREFLDANASIWTNLHGHNHPRLNAAVRQQLGRVAHSSALGLANEPASELAERLVNSAETGCRVKGGSVGATRLRRVFFSDDGSTALEVALKLTYEWARRQGLAARPRFLSMQGGYHGDTVGAVSLGHIDLFHQAYQGLLFRSDRVTAPYCYRCRFNRAKPERADARDYRRCDWECVGTVERQLERRRRGGRPPYAGFVFEPLIQGAAGMIAQPEGWLRRVSDLVRGEGTRLIADEVMTGFGRTGGAGAGASLYASHREGVHPDFLCLAKGLTGGYLPMAATLTTEEIFGAFLGRYEDQRTFFHGHSFTGNQLGAAAALASLELLAGEASRRARRRLERELRSHLEGLWELDHVGDVRQVGLVAGVELVRDWRKRLSYDWRERAGVRVCEVMARRGVLTRPVGNVIVLMPPYCTTSGQLEQIISALRASVRKELG